MYSLKIIVLVTDTLFNLSIKDETEHDIIIDVGRPTSPLTAGSTRGPSDHPGGLIKMAVEIGCPLSHLGWHRLTISHLR